MQYWHTDDCHRHGHRDCEAGRLLDRVILWAIIGGWAYYGLTWLGA